MCAAQEVLVLQVQVALGVADEVDVGAVDGRVYRLWGRAAQARAAEQGGVGESRCSARDKIMRITCTVYAHACLPQQLPAACVRVRVSLPTLPLPALSPASYVKPSATDGKPSAESAATATTAPADGFGRHKCCCTQGCRALLGSCLDATTELAMTPCRVCAGPVRGSCPDAAAAAPAALTGVNAPEQLHVPPLCAQVRQLQG